MLFIVIETFRFLRFQAVTEILKSKPRFYHERGHMLVFDFLVGIGTWRS